MVGLPLVKFVFVASATKGPSMSAARVRPYSTFRASVAMAVSSGACGRPTSPGPAHSIKMNGRAFNLTEPRPRPRRQARGVRHLAYCAPGPRSPLPRPMRRSLERAYGVVFPDDLYAFHDFMRAEPKGCRALGIVGDGPLARLAKRKVGVERFYDDPPELFSTLTGPIEGLHWGYWFDHPGRSAPVVAWYHANDAFEIRVDGSTLFEAVRSHLEAFHRDAEDSCEDDPDNAASYRGRLDDYAAAREALAAHSDVLRKRREIGGRYLDKYAHVTRPSTRRRPIAATRSQIGIVVDKKQYRPLGKQDPFETGSYEPNGAEVERFVAAARKTAAAGFPGAALKLGHDLWIYKPHHAASYEMLGLAYAALGRDVLQRQLATAIAYRRRCDASG